MNVSILRPVELHKGGTVLGVVPEVEGVGSLGHVDDVLAVEGVVGVNAVNGLFHPQALGVVNKAGGGAGLAHLLELAAVLPGVGPGAVAGRIANIVVRNRRAVVANQLVLPGTVIGISHSFQRSAHGAGGVGVTGLAQDIAAPVVGVDPGGARRAAGGIVLVIDPDQLAQIVVDIVGRLAVLGDTGGGFCRFYDKIRGFTRRCGQIVEDKLMICTGLHGTDICDSLSGEPAIYSRLLG